MALPTLIEPRDTVTDRPLIVLSLDGLATAALGCYGSSWNQTPAIDAIAGSGCVWDRMIAAHDDPMRLLETLFAQDTVDWAEAWRALGSVELLTDDPSVAELASCFDQVTTLTPENSAEQVSAVEEIEATRLATLLAATVERASEEQNWSVIWIHSNFLTQLWDAPRELFPIDQADLESAEPCEAVELLPESREIAANAEQLPPIFSTATVPNIELTDDSHPDLVTTWMRTYGCQVRLTDLMLSVLLQSLQAENPRVVLFGTSGFSLGQNGWIGHRAGPLRSAEVRLPMILSDVGPVRISRLTPQPMIGTILADLAVGAAPWASPQAWASPDSDAKIETVSERVRSAITTPKWFFTRDLDTSEHLFLKPDDSEDFNDVGRLRLDVLEQFDEDKK